MKTAMQELIELIVNNKTRLDIIEKNKQIWLEKEKEQIIETFENGVYHARYFREDEEQLDGEDYYNRTYNQNNNDKCGCFVSDGTTSMNCKFCGKHYSQHI